MLHSERIIIAVSRLQLFFHFNFSYIIIWFIADWYLIYVVLVIGKISILAFWIVVYLRRKGKPIHVVIRPCNTPTVPTPPQTPAAVIPPLTPPPAASPPTPPISPPQIKYIIFPPPAAHSSSVGEVQPRGIAYYPSNVHCILSCLKSLRHRI